MITILHQKCLPFGGVRIGSKALKGDPSVLKGPGLYMNSWMSLLGKY